jgi:hypothetical protein
MLREQYPDAERALVRIRCTYQAGIDNREETLRQLEEIFPRWYDREITEVNALGKSLIDRDWVKAKSFEETVREYLRQELINHPEALSRAVLERAEALMKEVQA